MAHPTLVPAATPNPLDHVTPDLSFLGAAFNSTWVRVGGGLWALALIVGVVFLGRAIVGMAQARHNGHVADARAAKGDAVNAGMALGGIAALGVLVGAILSVVGT